jgi:hypothetical protein
MNYKNVGLSLVILAANLCSTQCLGNAAEEAYNELRDSTAYGRFMHAAEIADKQGNNAEAEKNFSAAAGRLKGKAAPLV